ncbi:MAG: hypothetical protein J6Q89_05570 [Clostridia bacterium]|nr:hypothetical protein [Clostridia bacterium]
MPKNTDILNLFEYDVETDGKLTFNIGLALNDNFDKIDAFANGIQSLSNLNDLGEKRFNDINTQIAKSVTKTELYDSNGYIKIDKILKESYISGTSWYRIYSDGWIEQGGYLASCSNAGTDVNLLKSFSNTNYTIQVTPLEKIYNAHIAWATKKSKSVITLHSSANAGGTANLKSNWYACGY